MLVKIHYVQFKQRMAMAIKSRLQNSSQQTSGGVIFYIQSIYLAETSKTDIIRMVKSTASSILA